jgi:hypothetical protein
MLHMKAPNTNIATDLSSHMHIGKELITPILASAYLQFNTSNRPLSSHKVKYYSSQMKEGKWKFNGDTIRFSDDNRLIDGQHRLAAIIESGVAQEMLVTRGLDANVFDTIDNGLTRRASDVLSIEGVKNYKVVASGVNKFLTYKKAGNPYHGGLKSSHSEILEFVRSNPQSEDAGTCTASCAFGKKYITASAVCFGYLVAFDDGVEHEKIMDFFSRLDHPENGKIGDVTFKLRDRLMQSYADKYKMTQYEKTALMMKAMRLFFAGRDVKVLKISTIGSNTELDIFRAML